MTAAPHPADAGRGALAAALCYLTWGLVPLYWHRLAGVDALELIAHRLVWSLVFVAPLLFWLGGWTEARAALGTRRGFAVTLLSMLCADDHLCGWHTPCPLQLEHSTTLGWRGWRSSTKL